MNNQEQKNQTQPAFFGKEQASSYDQQWAKLAPLRDTLHLLLRIRLSELPDDAHVLCVGMGTGAELLYLAQAFPGWAFTLVDLIFAASEPKSAVLHHVARFMRVISILCLFRRLSMRLLAFWSLNSSCSKRKDETSLVKYLPDFALVDIW